MQRKQRVLLLCKNKIRRGSRLSLRRALGKWSTGCLDQEHHWELQGEGQGDVGLREPGAPRGTDVCMITWFPALQCLLLLISSFFFSFWFPVLMFELLQLWYVLENGKKFSVEYHHKKWLFFSVLVSGLICHYLV